MKIRDNINKFAFLSKRNFKNLLVIILTSFVYYLYLFKIAVPYGIKYNILVDENSTPSQSNLPQYVILTYPTYIFYVLLSFYFCIKCKFLRGIVYPAIFCSYIFSSYFCILTNSGSFIWLYILAFPILSILVIFLFLFGLILDIRTLKNTKQVE